MKKLFNFARYNKLLENQAKLKSSEKPKMFFTENELELMEYEASVARQIMYDRKDDYFLLIENYLQNIISFGDFSSQLFEMEGEDSRKAEEILMNPEELSKFYLLDTIDEVNDLIDEISDICFVAIEVGQSGFGFTEDLYCSIETIYSQFQNL